jgi:sugar phosphate isomerase/epimerase
LQKQLNARLIAYHIHDNDGLCDQHKRICTGTIDWDRFAEGVRTFTPNACMVMEYNAGRPEDYTEDSNIMKRLLDVRIPSK